MLRQSTRIVTARQSVNKLAGTLVDLAPFRSSSK